jgi:cellulose-binding protein
MKPYQSLFLALFAVHLTFTNAHAASPDSAAKPRLVVMTDIGGDPDDRQSMVRFLLYACDFDVEGLCTGFGHGHDEVTRPELIRDAVEAYGKVLPNLRKHRPDYPSAEQLMGLIKDGDNGDPHSVGPGRDSEASDWIIEVVDRDDPRPVWFSIWGGPRELAQAIWKVSQTRSAKELAKFKSKIRVHSIADQDRTAGWVKKNHPDVFWIYSAKLFRGIWKEGNQEIVSPDWLKENVLEGHGALGPLYPPKAAGKDGVKEGDTPSFLYVLPNGLSDPEYPGWGNWGGRFQSSGFANEFIPAEDIMDGKLDLLYSIHRWRTAYQNEFEARMDWCVRTSDDANHEPTAVCNGDKARQVLEIETTPGAHVELSAAESSDPDGDTLGFRWWVYREAGSYWDEAPIGDADKQSAVVTVPQEAAGRTIHVILEVTDKGEPPLVAYRRVILKVSGDPIKPPAGTLGIEEDLSEPVISMDAPSAKNGKWTFWRGVNINGPSVEIDGNRWEGENIPYFVCLNKAANSPQVALIPPTDKARARMIQAFRWGREVKIEMLRVPRGTYAVYAYVWEETNPETIRIRLNGQMVERDYYTGSAGRWKRLGPWVTEVDRGTITIQSEPGAANFSGIEVWRGTGDAK